MDITVAVYRHEPEMSQSVTPLMPTLLLRAVMLLMSAFVWFCKAPALSRRPRRTPRRQIRTSRFGHSVPEQFCSSSVSSSVCAAPHLSAHPPPRPAEGWTDGSRELRLLALLAGGLVILRAVASARARRGVRRAATDLHRKRPSNHQRCGAGE